MWTSGSVPGREGRRRALPRCRRRSHPRSDAPRAPALAQVPGLTYISVGHRPSLLQFHDTKLKLTQSGEPPLPNC